MIDSQKNNKHRILLLRVLPVLLVLVLAGFGWRILAPSGAVYEGKGLRYWLSEYEVNFLRDVHGDETGQAWERKEKAEEAIRAIGTNGIPVLLEMMGAHDSVLKKKLMELTDRLGCWRLQPYSAENYRGKAVKAFEFLEEKGAPAVPALAAYMRDPDADIRSSAAMALGEIGPAAQDSVPALVRGLRDQDREVRTQAAFALGSVHREPELVVSALIKCLAQGQTSEIALLWALRDFGTNAKPAVPLILPFLQHRFDVVRDCASKALQEIDPEALAKAIAK